MHWSDERYVRVYTRDTLTWKLWSYEARAVFLFMLRKVDRAGVLDVDGFGPQGLAAVLELPEEVVRKGLEDLLRRKSGESCATVEYRDTAYVIPKFIEAQEANATNAHRQREFRQRRRDQTRASGNEVIANSYADNAGNAEVGLRYASALQKAVALPAPPSDVTPSQLSHAVLSHAEPAVLKRELALTPRAESKIAALRTAEKSAEKQVKKPRSEIDQLQQRALEFFATQYKTAYGTKPTTPVKRDQDRLRAVLIEHGYSEFVLRVDHAFEKNPFPGGPWDLRALLTNFDRLVAAPAPTMRTASQQVTPDGVVYGRVEPVDGQDYSAPPGVEQWVSSRRKP